MPGRLEGRVAIVTASAGAGIGQATVRRLAAEGAYVVVSDIHEGRIGLNVDPHTSKLKAVRPLSLFNVQ